MDTPRTHILGIGWAPGSCQGTGVVAKGRVLQRQMKRIPVLVEWEEQLGKEGGEKGSKKKSGQGDGHRKGTHPTRWPMLRARRIGALLQDLSSDTQRKGSGRNRGSENHESDPRRHCWFLGSLDAEGPP